MKNHFKIALIAVLTIIGTFPENDWTYSIGIDPPLSWIYNSIYNNGMLAGKNIIFPHGPLAFFMYPLPENIVFVTVITSVLKILLVLNISLLFDDKEKGKWLFTLIIAYAVSVFASFNHLIIANIIILYCNYYNNEKSLYKNTAFILTAFSFYIKSYVAIISGVIFVSFIAYYLFFRHKDYKKTSIEILSLIGLFLLFWFMMYGNLIGFSKYVMGMFHLVQDNSSAAAYYPYNNWFILSIIIALILVTPLIKSSKKSLFYGALTTLSLFAAWKHGMAREDIFHTHKLLIYVGITLIIFIIFTKKNVYRNTTIATIVIVLLSLNIKNSVNYTPRKYELFRINNFIAFTSNFSSLKANAITESRRNISSNKLPQAIREQINNSTVDIYPWDYSIIAANNLNWQPRIVIQSYAAYTHWLDNKNAEHFNSNNAPEFIIWHIDEFINNYNGSTFNSIDNRYLLNDEPLTIMQILRSYSNVYTDGKFMVLKKCMSPIPIKTSIIDSSKSHWNEWIDVPPSNKGVLRAKLNFEKTFIQKLKSFLYKDEQFWVYLKLQNGNIHKYRIVPKNAEDGIWINPYIFDSTSYYAVEKISFKCSNQKIMTKDISVRWEDIELENRADQILKFFNSPSRKDKPIAFNSLNTFENTKQQYWKNKSDVDENGYNGKCIIVKPNAYSTTFTYDLDNIPFDSIKISTTCWTKASEYKYQNKIMLIISIDDENGNKLWKGMPIDIQLIDNEQWNHILNFCYYKHNKPKTKLNVYIWNTSENELLIDNFKVTITK